MEHLRIAFLLTVAPAYWHPLLSAMARDRHVSQLRLFTAGWPNFSQGFENAFEVEVVGSRKIFSLKRKQKGYGSGFMYLSPSIIKFLQQLKPNIIFADGFCIWTVLVLLWKVLGWQVIIVYDGSSPNVDLQNNQLRLLLRKIMVKHADALITNTNAGRLYLVDILTAPTQKVLVHPYLVPDANAMLQGALPPLEPKRSKQLIFLVVSQLIPRKGIEELLKSCALLLNIGYVSFKVWIIGEGWQKNDLVALGMAKGLEAHVHWVGKVDYHQLGHFLKQTDIFIFPTLEDVWGMAVPEAMIFGKPILCSKWAGSAELVIEGHNGYHFDPKEPCQLAKLMQEYIDNPKKISQMGIKSKQIMEKYEVGRAAQLLVEIATNIVHLKKSQK